MAVEKDEQQGGESVENKAEKESEDVITAEHYLQQHQQLAQLQQQVYRHICLVDSVSFAMINLPIVSLILFTG